MDDAQDRLLVLKLPEQLPSLLGDPRRVGLLGAACQVHAPCAHLDKEQDVYRLQEDSFDGEEVTGQHLRPIMVQEKVRQLLWVRSHSDAGRIW